MSQLSNIKLEQYIRLYHGTVYRLALGYVKNTAEAEDICQEAFVRLLDYDGVFDAPENCKAWLIRVTVNLSKNYFKSSRFRQNTELCDDVRERIPDEYTELYDAVTALPIKYRSIVHLYYYEGYSVKEIADILKISVTAATTRLSRARERLREDLLGEELS
ncbi:MAG: RNA polymerase sigma factor [Oscillospiraceae bacterium]|nr:RNA polymerase sigma factor [Oscillospiraceae bacterium]